MTWFSSYGSLYMISFPILVIIGYWLVPYMRYKVVKIGNLFFLIISLFFMTKLLISKSIYTKVSSVFLPTIF